MRDYLRANPLASAPEAAAIDVPEQKILRWMSKGKKGLEKPAV